MHGFNLHFPGQYCDTETGLHYNYFRDYDPAIGRYIESDPIGLRAGLNTFGYALGRPLSLSDFYGLDVLVCFYGNAAGGLGHVGFGSPGQGTSGFYPKPGSSNFGGPGEVKPDQQQPDRFDACKTIKTDDKQDKCMQDCKVERSNDPGRYHVFNRNCTMFVRDCLTKCGISAGSGSGPGPQSFFSGLGGAATGR